MITELVSANPATGEPIWSGEAADAGAVDAAVRVAGEAQPRWNGLGFDGRLEVAERFRTQVDARREELALLIAKETGKPLWDAVGEVTAVIGKIAISIEAYTRRSGEQRAEADGVRREVRHRPHGVMAVFGPYNFPAHLPNGHIVPALLAGNTVVLKPSEETPAVGEWMAGQWHLAGAGDGVVNIVQGGKDTGMALASHPEINGILFTGSYATGKAIHRSLAGRPELLLALEMGGNNPLVVWEAENTDAAAAIILQSAYISSGQRCTCLRRLILPEGKAGDEVLEAVLARIPRIRVGAYTDMPEPFMGPLINNAQAGKLLEAEAAIMARGGRCLIPLRRLREGLPFLSPGLLEVTEAVNLPDEEYFGPLLQVKRAGTFDAAITEANATAYGLAAGLISDNPALWEAFRERIRAGVINWNRPTTGASSASPFGGIGQSGNLRPSAYYAADYCAYPAATLAADHVTAPPAVPGLML